MIPVHQNRFGADGNCWAACVASLLEIALDEVVAPDFRGQGPDGSRWLSWATARNIVYLEVPRGSLVALETEEPPTPPRHLGWTPLTWGVPGPLCILCGPSPRFPGMNHCVVGRSNGYKVEVLHDPHPDGAGLESVLSIGYLVPLDPNPRLGLPL